MGAIGEEAAEGTPPLFVSGDAFDVLGNWPQARNNYIGAMGLSKTPLRHKVICYSILMKLYCIPFNIFRSTDKTNEIGELEVLKNVQMASFLRRLSDTLMVSYIQSYSAKCARARVRL